MVGRSLREVPTGLGTTQGFFPKLPETKMMTKMQFLIFRFKTSNHYYQVKPSSDFVLPGSKTATKCEITGTAACAKRLR